MQMVAFRAANSSTAPQKPTPTPTPTATPTPKTPTYVQGNYAVPQTPQTTVTVPYTATQAANDLNVIVVGWNDTLATVSTVTDSAHNTYQLAVGPTLLRGALSQAIYYAKNIAAAGANANTVTLTFSVAAVYPDVRILEYSGLDTSKQPGDAIFKSNSPVQSSRSMNRVKFGILADQFLELINSSQPKPI